MFAGSIGFAAERRRVQGLRDSSDPAMLG